MAGQFNSMIINSLLNCSIIWTHSFISAELITYIYTPISFPLRVTLTHTCSNVAEVLWYRIFRLVYVVNLCRNGTNCDVNKPDTSFAWKISDSDDGVLFITYRSAPGFTRPHRGVALGVAACEIHFRGSRKGLTRKFPLTTHMCVGHSFCMIYLFWRNSR